MSVTEALRYLSRYCKESRIDCSLDVGLGMLLLLKDDLSEQSVDDWCRRNIHE